MVEGVVGKETVSVPEGLALGVPVGLCEGAGEEMLRGFTDLLPLPVGVRS